MSTWDCGSRFAGAKHCSVPFPHRNPIFDQLCECQMTFRGKLLLVWGLDIWKGGEGIGTPPHWWFVFHASEFQ
jgi:hypothetical protein